MYGGIGDIWRDEGRRRKTDGVNQQGVGVRREIVWLPTLDAFRTFAVAFPAGMLPGALTNPNASMQIGGVA
jgi:hypothetical protein